MTDANRSGFGVGAQVFVVDASASDRTKWSEHPSGIIVTPGGSAIAGVWGNAERGRMWWVAFDEPQRDAEGREFLKTEIAERFLELAPPFDVADTTIEGNA